MLIVFEFGIMEYSNHSLHLKCTTYNHLSPKLSHSLKLFGSMLHKIAILFKLVSSRNTYFKIYFIESLYCFQFKHRFQIKQKSFCSIDWLSFYFTKLILKYIQIYIDTVDKYTQAKFVLKHWLLLKKNVIGFFLHNDCIIEIN